MVLGARLLYPPARTEVVVRVHGLLEIYDLNLARHRQTCIEEPGEVSDVRVSEMILGLALGEPLAGVEQSDLVLFGLRLALIEDDDDAGGGGVVEQVVWQ